MKKNTLAWIVASKNINEFVAPHKFMIEKICENFDELIILNLINFKLYDDFDFIESKEGNNKFLDQNKILRNKIKIFEPKDEKELKVYLKDKRIIGINNLGKSFSDFKIHFILKKNNIKMVNFGNIGNQQITQKILSGNLIKGMIFSLKTKLSKKVLTLLSILNIVPKNEINFTSNIDILRNIEKSKIKKFLYKKKLLYSKNIELVNSRTHDIFFEKKIDTSKEDQITYLDFNINHEIQISLRGNLSEEHINRYYNNLINFLNDISKIFDKKIVVCIHPRDNLEVKKKIFKDFIVLQNVTSENIIKSFLVVFFESSAIVDAILTKKKIITLFSDVLDENVHNGSNIYRDRLGITQIHLENYKNIEKIKLTEELNDNIKNYDKYIKDNISPVGNEIGYKKIFKILKENFFNN